MKCKNYSNLAIRSALRDFDCNWWSEEDERKGIIAEICGKKIKVCKN